MYVYMCVYVCVYVCMCGCVRARVYTHTHTHIHAGLQDKVIPEDEKGINLFRAISKTTPATLHKWKELHSGSQYM